MAGKIHGSKANIQITDSAGTLRDISADVTDISGLPGATEVADSTGLGSTAKTFITGLNDVKFALKGQYDDTALTGSHTVLSGIRGQGAKAFQYGPSGTAVGGVKITGSAILTDYTVNSPIGGITTFSASFQGSGDVTFGVF
ncbi:MAG: hypothetical protein ACYDHY_17450 [Acidiferrobacterales bacterium]